LVKGRRGYVMARFIILLFIFLLFLGLSPLLNASINASQVNLGCDTDYGFLCFIMDAGLPVLALVLLAMLVGYIKRE